MITKAQSQQRQQVILKAEEVEGGGDCITETHGVQCPLEMCVFRQVWEASRPMIMCATPLKENGILLTYRHTPENSQKVENFLLFTLNDHDPIFGR